MKTKFTSMNNRTYMGQHFLINRSAIRKIIVALELKKDDLIIEIGPGKGALTLPLAEECGKVGCKIIGIEKDPRLASGFEVLAFRKNLPVQILKNDALKILPKLTKTQNLKPKAYKLVGNIPYYITGKLLRVIGELEPKPKLVVLTIQKEVAERLSAKAGRMNLLAAAVQIWAEPKIIGRLKAKDFSPPPKVDSAIIKLTVKPAVLNTKRYYSFIKIVFRQPRKTLLNNLSSGLKVDKEKVLSVLESAGLNEKTRPQELAITAIVELLNRLPWV